MLAQALLGACFGKQTAGKDKLFSNPARMTHCVLENNQPA
jgi:hypothetical protein